MSKTGVPDKLAGLTQARPIQRHTTDSPDTHATAAECAVRGALTHRDDDDAVDDREASDGEDGHEHEQVDDGSDSGDADTARGGLRGGGRKGDSSVSVPEDWVEAAKRGCRAAPLTGRAGGGAGREGAPAGRRECTVT